jgi:hypothetical protein
MQQLQKKRDNMDPRSALNLVFCSLVFLFLFPHIGLDYISDWQSILIASAISDWGIRNRRIIPISYKHQPLNLE